MVPIQGRGLMTTDPIVIVGMGCRFPRDVNGPDDLWELVATGRNAITEPNRGLLRDGAEFDASFFGIAPEAARAMDSQHRLLLEVAWEALERAWIDPMTLRGSLTGVFAG